MVKLAPTERALASTVIPAGSAANLRGQQTQHIIVFNSRIVLPKTTCKMLQQKNEIETILQVKDCTGYNYHKQSKAGGKKHGLDS